MRFPILLCGLLLATGLTAQISQCEAWQYFGTDSAGKTIAKIEKYDAGGQLVYEQFIGWKFTLSDYPSTYEAFFEYSDTLLTKWTTVFEQDSSRMEFEYDAAGKRVAEHSYRRRYIMPDTVKSGMFTIDVVATDSTQGRWVLESEGVILYDRWGRRIFSETTYLIFPQTHTYTWTYDEKGRINTFTYSWKGKPRQTSEFEYYEGGHRYTRTYYDNNGKAVSRPRRKDPPYMHRKYFTIKLDAQGREIEERISKAKDKQIERTVTTYNADGKIAREVYYGADDKVEMTHVYVYK